MYKFFYNTHFKFEIEVYLSNIVHLPENRGELPDLKK